MGLINFIKPDRILLQKETEFHGAFEFKPLEPGFGVTVGNALRRVLLSSLEGHAIMGVKINGVSHEFSTIPGVLEDVTQIVLNLKQVRLKAVNQEDDSEPFKRIFLSVKNQATLTAGDIEKQTNLFQIVNPDLVICNMEKDVNLEMELIIGVGRGYVPAEQHDLGELPVGTILVDSIFTPIKNVRYAIENTRVEQRTDFEKLLVDITTDGTIRPEEAIKEAAKIVIHHFILISDEKISYEFNNGKEEEVVDEHVLQMRKLLKTPLDDLDLSVRAYNCLKSARIDNLYELLKYDTNELLRFRNFGRKSLLEIEQLLVSKGLSFGMDLNKFGLNED